MDADHIVAFVGLGSNLGDRAGNLLMAVRGLMEASFCVQKLSGIYETEPLGIDTDKCFLNMVAEIHVTNVSASQMMARLLRIEYLLERTEKGMNRPRTIDLDILLFGDAKIHNEFLTIPHPRMHERRFVLEPLCSIAPNFRHPTFDEDITALLSRCGDDSEVKRWSPNQRIKDEG